MSSYRFIAGKKEFDEYVNGIQVINSGMICIDEKNGTLNIFREEVNPYTEAYTELPYIVCIEMSDFEKKGDELLEYVKKQLESHDTLELWDTWMDEVEEPEHRSCRAEDITLEDLRWIYGGECYEKARVLKIFKWSRGEK